MHKPADRIRNVALVGHRGSGKTSLHEALLFEAGTINRMGSVVDGTTMSDSDPDEKARQMSITAAMSSFEWQERKVNLIDTPGDSSFIADALGALRVCESAIFVINGVMGVEVHASRLWQRAAELDLARLIFVNMLDRERADFFRTLESLKSAFGQHVVATEIPIGSEHEIRGVIDLVDMTAYEYEGAARENCKAIPIPDELADQAQEYREKLMDEVAENSDALMERYLEGEEISHDEIVTALKDGTNHGAIFPVTCGVATRNLATNRLLDAIVEDLPSPVKHGGLDVGEVTLEPVADKEMFAYVFKTRADPFAGRINLFRVYQGEVKQDSQVLNTRTHTKERIGTLLTFEGGRHRARRPSSAPATSARWPSSRRPRPATGWPRATSRSRCRASSCPRRSWPSRSSPRARATRRRCSRRCAASRRRTRRSTCTATSRPASRSWPVSRRSTSR